jgi:hypothetical protein
MERIVIMSWYDSNIAGHEWVINIELSQRENNLFSLRAVQLEGKKTTYKSPVIYPIKDAKQLMAAVTNLFQNDLISHMEINWEEILMSLAIPFPRLGQNLKRLVIDSKNDIAEDVIQTPEKEGIENTPLNEWLSKATWPKSSIRDPFGIGAMVENSRRRTAVFQYLKNFYEQTGTFPTGRHLINESVPANDYPSIPSKFNFIVKFPSRLLKKPLI